MVRSSIVITALALTVACVGCGASTASQERNAELPLRLDAPAPMSSVAAPAPVAVPDNPIDKAIRRDLNLAIARDADLKDRRISFIVANGDVSVNGTVGTEEERKRINNLAMNVSGVKSVANALLIAE